MRSTWDVDSEVQIRHKPFREESKRAILPLQQSNYQQTTLSIILISEQHFHARKQIKSHNLLLKSQKKTDNRHNYF